MTNRYIYGIVALGIVIYGKPKGNDESVSRADAHFVARTLDVFLNWKSSLLQSKERKSHENH